MPSPDDELLPMAEKLEFDGVLDEADAANRTRLEVDTEWSEPEYVHVHTLVTAFMHGISTADPWHKGYRLPPNFEAVVNWIAHCIQAEFKDTPVPKLSLIEIEDKFRGWAMQNPHFRAWNEPKDPGTVIAVTTRYAPTPDERDFIDLDALLRNASVFVRNEHRRERDFEERFDSRSPNRKGITHHQVEFQSYEKIYCIQGSDVTAALFQAIEKLREHFQHTLDVTCEESRRIRLGAIRIVGMGAKPEDESQDESEEEPNG